MRNLKSMVAFLVVAAMLFASVTSFAYGDVAADADYATAVEVLSALEILKGDDKGNFNPDNTITRAESAAVIVRLLGLEEAAAGAAGATQFVDVAADHWGSGYINMAAQSGIIAGYGDGNFGPEDAVTYEQFVKMLVCALGYEPKALTKGTYPTGYLIAAKEMKLTKGVSGAAGQEAPRSVVAELAYNALDINLMEQSGWGSDISYEVATGKTLLTEKLEI
ncbi:MAG: S-layer homology domain-containing protein, partial [Clostridia bacterium]|nr:S-layer homology domain-containing protein [Clostridia bacterium]